MRSLFPVIVCCISLVSMQHQPQALPAGTRLERSRLSFIKSRNELGKGEDITPGTAASPTGGNQMVPVDDVSVPKWKLRLFPKPLLRKTSISPANGDQPLLTDGTVEHEQRGSRGRRHAHNGARNHRQAQLMRVGCVLGTCQVQNLSHRLYQLIGQSGREDSSPINPKSPHSYG